MFLYDIRPFCTYIPQWYKRQMTPSWAERIEAPENPLWTSEEAQDSLEAAWLKLFGEQYDPKAALDSFQEGLGFWAGRGTAVLFPRGRVVVTVEGWGSFIYRLPQELQCGCTGKHFGAKPFGMGHDSWCEVAGRN